MDELKRRHHVLRWSAVLGAVAIGLAASISQVEQPMSRLSFECDTDSQCAATPPCLQRQLDFEQGKSSFGCDGGPTSRPYRLVGYDCKGYNKPLFRDEEDEFPTQCKAIEPTWAVE